MKNSTNSIRQSGGFEFHFASKNADTELFEMAFSTAKYIIEDDPELKTSEYERLGIEVRKRVNPDSSIFS